MPAAALIVALAVVLRLVLGPGAIGYDAAWALEWGREIAAGSLPSFEIAGAPTPHPLANAVGVILAPLGGAGATALMAISWLSLAAVGVFAFSLGRQLSSPWTGALFAAILVTRGLLVRETQQAIVDVAFLALVLAAMTLEARRPREGPGVPLLLCAAGLLRPEGWLLSGAWLVWASRGAPLARVRRHAVIVLAAPVLWCLQDLLVTGDPLHSLHGTRELAADLGRPTEVGTALAAAPDYLRFALGDEVFWLGLAGAGAALAWMQQRMALPLVILGLGLAGFVVLGVAGLPLLIRYVLLPAAMLALFAAVAALGWTALGPDDRGRRWWLAAGLASTALLVVSVPGQASRLRDLQRISRPRLDVQADLRRLADRPAVRATARRCRVLGVPDARPRPLLALWLERPPETLPRGAPGGGLVLTYATPEAARAFSLGEPATEPGRLPPGTRVLERNRSWLLGTRC